MVRVDSGLVLDGLRLILAGFGFSAFWVAFLSGRDAQGPNPVLLAVATVKHRAQTW